MAFLSQPIETKDLPEGNDGDFQPLPAGWYTAKITSAELKQTNAKTGELIAVRYDIIAPSHQGRVVFSNLNIKNPNPKAEEIGRQQLGDLMRAIGLARVTDTDQLIGGTLQIKLAVKPAELNDKKEVVYEAKNEVKAYKAAEGGIPAMPQQASAPASAPAQATAAASPPWARK
jgi:hypothetical protein